MTSSPEVSAKSAKLIIDLQLHTKSSNEAKSGQLSHNMCDSEVVILYQFRELWTDRGTLVAYRKGIWRVPGYPWSYHKSAQLADSPTHSWNTPVSHTGVKAQSFSTDSCCHSYNRPPQMGPPILPFGRVNFHSNGHLRKRHLGPAWCHNVTNSELLNH